MASSSSSMKGHQSNEQGAMLGSAEAASSTNLHPDAQWFPDAGLGLFIHWGIASVHGNLDLSWSMVRNTTWDVSEEGRNKVTPRQYWALADRFRPDAWDPDRILAAASEAGFKYAVLTAMHHDGYTLWPSAAGNFGVQRFLPGVDLVKPYIDACRKHGLKVGVYLSPPDWYQDREWMSFDYLSFGATPSAQAATGASRLDQDHLPAPLLPEPDGQAELRRQRFHQRVEELLTQYGRTDLLWFDGGTHDNEIRDRARMWQPGIVINSRSCDGDYDCTECELPEGKINGWFETCHCWQSSRVLRQNGKPCDVWGYLDTETYKSAEWMVETYQYLNARRANLLLNVSPGPRGDLPDVVYQRFREVADLLDKKSPAS